MRKAMLICQQSVSLPRKMELDCFRCFNKGYQEMLLWLSRPSPFPVLLQYPLCSPTYFRFLAGLLSLAKESMESTTLSVWKSTNT